MTCAAYVESSARVDSACERDRGVRPDPRRAADRRAPRPAGAVGAVTGETLTALPGQQQKHDKQRNVRVHKHKFYTCAHCTLALARHAPLPSTSAPEGASWDCPSRSVLVALESGVSVHKTRNGQTERRRDCASHRQSHCVSRGFKRGWDSAGRAYCQMHPRSLR